MGNKYTDRYLWGEEDRKGLEEKNKFTFSLLNVKVQRT